MRYFHTTEEAHPSVSKDMSRYKYARMGKMCDSMRVAAAEARKICDSIKRLI